MGSDNSDDIDMILKLRMKIVWKKLQLCEQLSAYICFYGFQEDQEIVIRDHTKAKVVY